MRTLLERCEYNAIEVAAQSREVIPAGPFRALLDPSTDLIWLNYAVPVAPLEDSVEIARALDELRGIFAERHRTVRFEFTEALWPSLPPLLEAAGLELQARHPFMLCTPADFQPVHAPGVRVQLLTATDDDEALSAFHQILVEGFGEEGFEAPTAEALARFRHGLEESHTRHALASLNETPAGAGSIAPTEEVAELGGVATLPALRRRGVAATLSSVLVQHHFNQGGTLVWLSAGDAIAESVYRKIGFRLAGTRLNYIDILKDDLHPAP